MFSPRRLGGAERRTVDCAREQINRWLLVVLGHPCHRRRKREKDDFSCHGGAALGGQLSFPAAPLITRISCDPACFSCATSFEVCIGVRGRICVNSTSRTAARPLGFLRRFNLQLIGIRLRRNAECVVRSVTIFWKYSNCSSFYISCMVQHSIGVKP